MSLLPIFFGDSMMDSFRPSRILDQHFGVPIEPEDLMAPFTIPQDFRMMMHRPGYYRPWRSTAGHQDNGSTVACDKNKFQVNLDVQQFKPSEISVKVTGDKQITIEGKHEEKQDDHGSISRHFVRRYAIPKNYDMENVVSHLSSDGVLTITAPCVDAPVVEHREIPIKQTGQPAIDKSNDQKED